MYKLLKKSQLWYYDLIVALFIFTIILFVSFLYLKDNQILQDKEITGDVMEIEQLSESLMTGGIPTNWTIDDVTMPGIVTDGTLDLGKIKLLRNMTSADYARARLLLGVKKDFLVIFGYDDQLVDVIPSLGKEGYNLTAIRSESPEDITQVTRYVVYRHDGIAEIIPMKVILWG